MDRLIQIKSCILQLNGKENAEDINAVNSFLIQWTHSQDFPSDAIGLLTTETNPTILFHAACGLHDFLTHANIEGISESFLVQIGESLASIVLTYISDIQSQGGCILADIPFFRFLLISIADSCAFSKGILKLEAVCANLPFEISHQICVYFFEEWNSYINTKWTIDNSDIEFTMKVLNITPLSKDWIRLYASFAESYPETSNLMVFMPKLHDLLEIPESYPYIINHIQVISEFIFTEYTHGLFQLTIKLSMIIRNQIELEQTVSIKDSLNALIDLWSTILGFSDEEDSIFSEAIIPTFSALLEEFAQVDCLLFKNIDKLSDFTLFPALICAMCTFGESLGESNPYIQYISPILTFLLNSSMVGIDLNDSDISESIRRFYFNCYEVINQYLMDPNQALPSTLTLLSVLACENNKEKMPREIPLFYLNNIQAFGVFPKEILGFSLQFIDILGSDDDCLLKFGQIFLMLFERFPFECSKGLFKLNKINSMIYFQLSAHQILCENYQAFLNSNDESSDLFETSSNPLCYNLPCIILGQSKLFMMAQTEKEKQEAMNGLNLIGGFILEALKQSFENVNMNIINFFAMISSSFQNLNTCTNELILQFGRRLVVDMLPICRPLFSDFSNEVQLILYHFMNSAFQCHFFCNEAVPQIAEWINIMIAHAPNVCHFELLRFLVDHFEKIPAASCIMTNCILLTEESCLVNSDIVDYAIVTLNSFIRDFPHWDSKFNVLFPYQLLLRYALSNHQGLADLAYMALFRILEGDNTEFEFMYYLTSLALNRYGTNRPNIRDLNKIYAKIGENCFIKLLTDMGTDSSNITQFVNEFRI